jgi:hypothetical protein
VKKQDQKLKDGKAKLTKVNSPPRSWAKSKATAGADQSLRDELIELTKKLSAEKV